MDAIGETVAVDTEVGRCSLAGAWAESPMGQAAGEIACGRQAGGAEADGKAGATGENGADGEAGTHTGAATHGADGADPAGLSVAGLEAALVGAAAVEAAGKARFLALLGEFVAREGWDASACVSPIQWLSWRCGLGPTAASEHVRVATALRGLPAVASALAAGAITWSKVRAITRVAGPASEQMWLDVALSATAAQVEQIVRNHRRVTADEADEQEETRSLSWRQTDRNASVRFVLEVPAEAAAALVAAVEERTTPAAGVPIAARRADALVELVLGPDIATPTVTIITTAEAMADDGMGPCATDTGIAIDPGTAAAAACDGPVITADDEGVYRQQRYPTAATRRLLALRDPTCRFPGCHHTGRREAHHLIHWVHGGSRQPDNLVLLCPAHHRLIHRRGITLRIDRNDNVTAWTSDATPYHPPIVASVQPAPHPTADPHPNWDGHRLDHHWIATCLATASAASGRAGPSFPREISGSSGSHPIA